MHTNPATPKTIVEAKKEQREQLCSDVACKCKKATRCAEVATTLKRTNRQRSTSNSTMKAELVADSVEANPFPYKATKTQNKARRKADPRRILHTNLVSPKQM